MMDIDLTSKRGFAIASAMRGPDFVIRHYKATYNNLHVDLKHTFTARIRSLCGCVDIELGLRSTSYVFFRGTDVKLIEYRNNSDSHGRRLAHYVTHVKFALRAMMDLGIGQKEELELLHEFAVTIADGSDREIALAFHRLRDYGDLNDTN